MGDPAGGKEVDAGFGDGGCGRFGDGAGRFGDAAAAHLWDGRAQGRGRHVVEEHHVGADREHVVELRQRVDLDLDLLAGGGCVGRFERVRNAAGGGDVVVLDQDRIKESEAVIDTAAAARGV